MKQFRSVGLLIGAFCLAGLSAWTGVTYLNNREAQLREEINAEINRIKVVVAARDLSVGDIISPDTMQYREIPASYVPDSAIMPEDYGAVAGMVINQSMSAGKPLLRNYIQGIAGVEKFSELLNKGERALTLEVDRMDNTSGMLETGDFVDVVLVMKEGSGFVPLLDRVLVLATGRRTVADPPGYQGNTDYTSITIGVKDKEVPKIIAATGKGDLLFLLRNPDDKHRSRYQAVLRHLGPDGMVEVFAGGNANQGVLNPNYVTVQKYDWLSDRMDPDTAFRIKQKFIPPEVIVPDTPVNGSMAGGYISAEEENPTQTHNGDRAGVMGASVREDG